MSSNAPTPMTTTPPAGAGQFRCPARATRDYLTRDLAEWLARGDAAAAAAAAADDDEPGAAVDAAHLADALLRDAVRERATDVHLDPQSDGVRVRFRVDGRLLDATLLGHGLGKRLLRRFKVMSGMDSADHFRAADARMTHSLDGREIDLRLACVPARFGEKLSIRLLDRLLIEHRLDQLGLADEHRYVVERWLGGACGMFLVAGPTGSGKTTTLYALLHEMKLQERSVVTIEDPVEYEIDGITQIQVDRRHGLDFAGGLKAMLRLDPDYLLVGEVRDAEVARAAVEASCSGRVLMSTIHAADAAATITALRNFGLADHEIATSVRMVVGQRLVRRLCCRCRRRQPLTDAQRQWLASVALPTLDEAWVADGCDACRNLGYDGRIGVFEVWQLTDADYARILAHGDERALRSHAAAAAAPSSLLRDGYEKVAQGVTSLDELRAVSSAYPAGAPPAG